MDEKEYLKGIYEKYHEVKMQHLENEFYDTKMKRRSTKPLQMVATLLLTIGIMVGMVYAGVVTYQNYSIWKQPKKQNYKEAITIQEEDRKASIPEEKAIELAYQILEKFGYVGDKIVEAELTKTAKTQKTSWWISTKNDKNVTLNGEDGSFQYFYDEGTLFEKVNYHATKEEAIQAGQEIYRKLGYQEGEYILNSVNNNLSDEGEAYLWYLKFCKQYEGINNPYQQISIGFVPQINRLLYVSVNDIPFENNPANLTEEQACAIAVGKDKELEEGKGIKSVTAKLGIKQMNSDVYEKETNREEYTKRRKTNYQYEELITYQMEEHVRKVWIVVIEHEQESEDLFDGYTYTYYVDATTGEIVGGLPMGPIATEGQKTVIGGEYE